MISTRAQRTSRTAMAPARSSQYLRSSTRAAAARPWSSQVTQARCRGSAALSHGELSSTTFSTTSPGNAYTTRSIAGARHGSSWTPGRRGARTRDSWHKSGCSWVSSTGDSKTTARDKDCPACQEEAKDPFEYSGRELTYQRHRQQMDAIRRHIEKDPYEALFGWSNRRLNALWGRSPLSSLMTDFDSHFAGRASLHSDAARQAPDSGRVRKIPIQTEDAQKPSATSKSTGNPDIQASMSWRTSTTDSKGRTHEESGDLVYDPISNRMVPRDQWFENASPTAIGKGVHAQAMGDKDTSSVKYARPSSDSSPESREELAPEFMSKIDQIKRVEADLEQAKEQASTAAGVQQDAKAAGWTQQQPDSTPAPTDFSANVDDAPMQKIVYNAEHMQDKYVTPSQDPVDSPTETSSSEDQSVMQRVQKREAQLQQAKQEAISNIGVEEDAQRVGWTNKDLKPERPVSATPVNQNSGRMTPLEPSLGRHLAKASKSRVETSRPIDGTEESLNETESAAMHRIKAREREIGVMKQKLDFLKAKRNMEESWRREVESSAKNGSQQIKVNKMSSQAERDAQRVQANAWSSFKSGSSVRPSNSKVQADTKTIRNAETQPKETRNWPWKERTTAIGDEPIYAPTEHRESKDPVTPTFSVKSPKTNASSTINPLAWQERNGSRALAWSFCKEKPLKEMNFQELVEHRARLSKDFAKQQEPAEKPDATTERMQGEVSRLKNAMNAFENKWRHRATGGQGSLSAQNLQQKAETVPFQTKKQTSTDSSPQSTIEMTAGEGDMNPKVVQFARNGRWYKDKAPHAKMTRTELESKDEQLVKDIRAAYEGSYGPITEDHQQEKPIRFQKGWWDTSRSNFTERAVGFAPATQNKAVSKDSSTKNHAWTPVNPIDGTTHPIPDLTPQTGNFASPTGFVNHNHPLEDARMDSSIEGDRKASEASILKADTSARRARKEEPVISARRVRKEEPVFSGQLSQQKYTIPEVVKMLKKQGVTNTTQNGSAGSAAKSTSRTRSGERQNWNSQDSNDFGRSVKYVLVGGGFGAGICYAIGILVEYAREPRVQGGYDQGRPTWDSQRGWRGQQAPAQAPRLASPASQVRDERAHAVSFSDMPLRGFEYPMMGALVACIWYILSSGGS